MTFDQFGLAEPIVRAVTAEGYAVATPIQAQAIPAVMSGRDVVGIAQTGTGKTAAFALPILHQLSQRRDDSSRQKPGARRIRVLVLASTRELALQIHESFANYGAFAAVRVAVIYGGVGQQPQVNALRQGVDVVVATPGRLLDLMQQGFVKFDHLQTLVLDEADRMLDMGFFPAIRRILEKIPKQRQTLMFSATMKPEIRELADSILRDPIGIAIEPKKKTTELVEQSVCFVPQKQKTRLLIELIRRANPWRTIVFSRTKHGADRIVRTMTTAGLRAEAIHANKSQNKRQRILDEFKGENPPILVATDIAARGIDVDQVSHVFNHDMPTEEETYVHRIGRSGRAGATGIAVSLCDPDERRMLRSIEKLIGMSIRVEQIEGFEFTPTEESEERSERPQRTHADPRHPSNRRRPGQRSAHGQRSAQGQRPAQRHGQRPQTGQRNHEPRPAGPRHAGSSRREGATTRPERTMASERRPIVNHPIHDEFGDGVGLSDGTQRHAQGEQPRRRRRRRRPTANRS